MGARCARGLPPAAWLGVVLALVAGCASAGRAASARDEAPGITLELLAETRIPKEVDRIGRVGGLSGASIPQEWSVGRYPITIFSDKRERTIDGHEFESLSGQFRIERDAGTGEFGIAIENLIPVSFPNGFAPWWPKDAEAVACNNWNNTTDAYVLFIAYEAPPTIIFSETFFGAGTPERVIRDMMRPPVLVDEIGPVDPPDRMEPLDRNTLPIPADITDHYRPNRAFESMTRRERRDGGAELWAAMEAALTIDGEEATPEAGSLCRVLVYDIDTVGRWSRWPDPKLERQLFYETDPKPTGLPGLPTVNSLAEMAALPDGRLLFLERSLAAPAGYNARIYVVDPERVTEHEGRAFPTLDKVLVADLKKGPGPVSLGNLEAMVVGPPIADLTGIPEERGRLLLLIADDNFGRDGQVGSQALAYRMVIDAPEGE
jgi:hypothetical protein